jgi:hypothetical protein
VHRPLIRLEVDFQDDQGTKAVLIDPIASAAARNPTYSFWDDDFWTPTQMAQNLASALQEVGYPVVASVVDAATVGGTVGVSHLAGELVEAYQLYSVAEQQARYFTTGPGSDSGLFGVFAGFSGLRGMDRTTGELVTRLRELPWTKVGPSKSGALPFDVQE